jgi:hypothetical protein
MKSGRAGHVAHIKNIRSAYLIVVETLVGWVPVLGPCKHCSDASGSVYSTVRFVDLAGSIEMRLTMQFKDRILQVGCWIKLTEKRAGSQAARVAGLTRKQN